MLINLISNALKFTHRGSITVTVRFEAPELCFEVRDTGCGISEESQAKLFQMFSLVEETLAVNETGCGLGLTICKLIVEKLGGEITLISDVGEGTRVRF